MIMNHFEVVIGMAAGPPEPWGRGAIAFPPDFG